MAVTKTYISATGKILNSLWKICYAIGKISIVVSGQILKYNLTDWSHCWAQTW